MPGEGLGILVDGCTHLAVHPSHGTNPVLRGGQNVHVGHRDWPMETGTQLQLRRLKSGTALRRLRRQFLPVAQAAPPHTRAHWSRLSGRALQPPATPCQEERFNVSGGWGETVVSEPAGYQSDGVCPSPGDCIGTASVTTSTGGVTSSSCSSCYPQGGCLSTCTYAANWIQAGTCPGSSSGTLGNNPGTSSMTNSHKTSHVLAICRHT